MCCLVRRGNSNCRQQRLLASLHVDSKVVTQVNGRREALVVGRDYIYRSAFARGLFSFPDFRFYFHSHSVSAVSLRSLHIDCARWGFCIEVIFQGKDFPLFCVPRSQLFWILSLPYGISFPPFVAGCIAPYGAIEIIIIYNQIVRLYFQPLSSLQFLTGFRRTVRSTDSASAKLLSPSSRRTWYPHGEPGLV